MLFLHVAGEVFAQGRVALRHAVLECVDRPGFQYLV